MKVYVNYNDKRWKKYAIDFEKIAIAAGPRRRGAEVSITLTNDTEIHKLNKEYRNINKPTNVLSFELGDDLLLGDIYISLDTVMREATAAGISVAEHTAHMVVHGMLHLQGYDHIHDADAEIMESREIEIMKKLGYKNPYADDEKIVCANGECCPGARTIAFFKRLKIRENGFWQFALYALFGGVAAFGFAPFYMWWTTIIGIGGAYWLTTRRKNVGGFWREMLRTAPFGAMYSIAMFWWCLHSIYVVPELTKQFAIWTAPAVLGLGIAGALIFTIPFAALTRARVAGRPFMFAGVWTFILWLREWAFTGFPWNPVANITMQHPSISNSMSVWGALGLTFVIVGTIAAAVELLRNIKSWRNWVVFLLFIIIALCGRFAGIHNITVSSADAGTGAKIRIVQPARSQSQKMVYSRADALTRAEENLVMLFQMAATDGGDKPDLIVFPETSYPFTITDGDDMPLATALKTNVVIGATSVADGRPYNSMIVAGADGNINNIYSKSHLVPFGEYRPLGFMPAPVDLAAGDGAELISINMDGGDFVFAPAVCYEVIFSDSLVPRDAGLRPDAVINITNDTWFGKTPGTYQHLDMVRRYAIESGLPIVRANYSGISAFVLSDGEIVASLPIGQSGVLDGTIWGAHDTPYRRIGRDGWMIIILILSCIGVICMNAPQKKD